MDKWNGCVALVTGASEGIGADVARRLVTHGLKVIGCARTYEKLGEVQKSLEESSELFYPFKCDITKEDEVGAMFKKIKEDFNQLHICICNAGTALPGRLLTGETQMWREMLDLNVLAQCLCVREAVKLMKATGVTAGHVVLVNSTSGYHLNKTGNTNTNFYCATKHAITALTEGIRKELRQEKSQIRISAVSPGVVRTDLHEQFETAEAIHEKLQVKKPLETEDTSDAIVYLLSAPQHVQVHDLICKSVDFV